MSLENIKVGFAMCGSFCTFSKAFIAMQGLVDLGCDVTPIMSFNARNLSTRFGKANENAAIAEDICGKKIICTIEDAEPIGPNKMFDILLIAPCTGNTMAKLALGITDTPVTMAAKSHIRNSRPIVLCPATNDALANSAKNIGLIMNYRNYFFVPYTQDDSQGKPFSIVADFNLIPDALESALNGVQLQPILKK